MIAVIARRLFLCGLIPVFLTGCCVLSSMALAVVQLKVTLVLF